MRSLTVSDMQIIEIIKAISVNAKVIIMDEPTSSITESEVAVLHEQIHKLRKWESALSISHTSWKRSDRWATGVTVIRDGRVISSHGVDELDDRRDYHEKWLDAGWIMFIPSKNPV